MCTAHIFEDMTWEGEHGLRHQSSSCHKKITWDPHHPVQGTDQGTMETLLTAKVNTDNRNTCIITVLSIEDKNERRIAHLIAHHET